MKKFFGILFAVAILSTGAKAAPLTDSDQSYIVAVSASAIVASRCSATMVPSSAIKLADKLGVNAEILYPAIMAAVKANANLPYERADMIPEVTSLLVHTMIEITGDLMKDQKTTCSQWVGGLRLLGMVQ